MENSSLSLEERLRSDKNGEFSRELSAQLEMISLRLESEKRKLHDRSTYEKIIAAETAVKSAIVELQFFETERNK